MRRFLAVIAVCLALPLAACAVSVAPERAEASPQATSRPASASPPREPRDVSALLRPLREHYELPGIVGAIVDRGELVALGADGVRKRDAAVPITAQDRMHLGSCTKAMTATLCAIFVEEGKLSWQTKLGEVFEDVEMQPAWRDVTLEMLLTHRSGAPASLDAGGLWQRLWERQGTPVEQRLRLVRGVLAREPAHAPGT